jgi:hypothetical protein
MPRIRAYRSPNQKPVLFRALTSIPTTMVSVIVLKPITGDTAVGQVMEGDGFRGGRGPAANQSTACRQGLPQGKGRGAGPAYGRGLGPGKGRGLAPGGMRFVDTNKNGICDSYETSVKKN